MKTDPPAAPRGAERVLELAKSYALRFQPRYGDDAGVQLRDELLNAIRDALQAAPASPPLEKAWRCFHCDEVFTDEAEARDHFGGDEGKVAACRLSRDDVRQLRALELLNAKWQRECENLENDARLWHESEADRVRRIGHVQWWQELDSREGEKLALQERVSTLESELAALRANLGAGREPQDSNDVLALRTIADIMAKDSVEGLNLSGVARLIHRVLRALPAPPGAAR